MAADVQTATQRPSSQAAAHGLGGTLKVHVGTVEAAAAATAGSSFYTIARLPSAARIMGGFISYDDLGTSTGATLDVGVYSTYTGQITDDEDAINDGLDADAAAVNEAALVKDPADYGKRVWEFVNGQTADPGGELDIKVSLEDADLAGGGGGTITVRVDYILE